MLNNIYSAIKLQLSSIETAENTQWFNMQYENKGWPFANGFFVEFPDALDFEFISNSARKAAVKVRIHAYSKFVQTQDGVSDSEVLTHETLALAVKTALERFAPEKDSVQLTKPLLFSGWRHWHRLNGWMVTYIEFNTSILL
ncbi:hypothetical protein [uncultured Draconibacterium sp.]|uniref:hypothetical protein n=1 Tax=uncultured Draconibacterium sp. TaxID=1573823 RepID=UPI003217C6D7